MLGTDWEGSTSTVHLLGRREVAERTLAFEFEKPRGYQFRAGQSMDVTLPALKDVGSQEATHTFSIASAPHEGTLMVATRMRDSSYKRALGSLPVGGEVLIGPPQGQLVLPEGPERPVAILAGGIGITPSRSMLLDAAHRGLPHRIVLFYSNRRPEDAAFLDELQQLESRNPHFTLVATMTQTERSLHPWKGERGPIDLAMVLRHRDPGMAPVYYLAGPPAMVYALRTLLTGNDVKDADIRTEEFYGYG